MGFMHLVLTLHFFICQVLCGELAIHHSPASLQFKSVDPLHMQELSDIYGSALGIRAAEDQKWSGMKILDAKDYPEAIATLIIEGPLNLQDAVAHYKLKLNHELKSLQDNIKKNLNEYFPEEKLTIVDLDVDATKDLATDFPSFLQQLPQAEDLELKYLKRDDHIVSRFVKEVQMLTAAVRKISETKELKNKISDVFWFHVKSLKPIVQQFGENSPEAEEARGILRNVIVELEEAFRAVYGDKFVFAILSLHQHHHSRHVRAAGEKEGNNKTTLFSKLNLSKEYSSDYSAIFNIILWSSVALIWIVIATSAFIGNMDPGRDSIIYRMTSQRMKKDL